MSFFIIVPFISTPAGEELFYAYQETEVHKSIYCKYAEWFGTQGFSKLKFVVKCKLPF